jgi:hypothetical protein
MRIAEQDLSDRDRPACTSEAGLVAARRSLRAAEGYHDRQIDQEMPVVAKAISTRVPDRSFGSLLLRGA